MEVLVAPFKPVDKEAARVLMEATRVEVEVTEVNTEAMF